LKEGQRCVLCSVFRVLKEGQRCVLFSVFCVLTGKGMDIHGAMRRMVSFYILSLITLLSLSRGKKNQRVGHFPSLVTSIFTQPVFYLTCLLIWGLILNLGSKACILGA
ncbi:MAG: hypothetical protein CO090_02350, partial [Acidobacteria bacterium CG_4_9_14_3_um_filter_49_7]